MGRHKDQTALEKAEKVLSLFSEGVNLHKALKETDLSLYLWNRALSEDQDLSDRFERTKVGLTDVLASQVVSIADDENIEPGRASNMIKARQWIASKWNSRQYGDKMDVSVSQSLDIRMAIEDARARIEGVIEVEAKKIALEDKSGE